jgi:Xaa-Pro aminopeptidase
MACATLLWLSAAAAGANEFSEDLAARRAQVMQRIGPDAMLILWSAPVQRYSLDVDYEYRQDSNLYYLTGIAQEGTILVLMPGNVSRREILFVRERNAAREHWNGRTLSTQEASARTGIQTILTTGQFDGFVAAMLGGRQFGPVDDTEAARFLEALTTGRGRVGVLLGTAGVGDPLTPTQEFARRIRERFVGFEVFDATNILTDLRMVKTPYEQKLLIRSLEIASEAHLAGMQAARPGAYEYEVKAAIEAVHRSRGAVSWSYPSIVGSGPNATILHYPEGNRQMRDGDLLLVDAACNYEYMSGDLTRTYPVNGVFSERQRELYSIVLEAQEAGMAAAAPGSTADAIHRRTVEVVKAGLLKLGLITDPDSEQYKTWYTHGAVHYIGIDVHDVGSNTRPLQPGMTFVIEPGIYIRQSALDALPRTRENDEFIEKVTPVAEQYADIGVRVEDAFLLDEGGLRRLSASVPRTIEEIEAFMRARQSP